MKNFMQWIGLLALFAVALFATSADWLPGLLGWVETLQALGNQSAGLESATGFNWTAAGGVIFFGVVLLIYLNTGNVSTDEETAGIDYSVPRWLNVKVIE